MVGSFEDLYKIAQIASLHSETTDQIEAFFMRQRRGGSVGVELVRACASVRIESQE